MDPNELLASTRAEFMRAFLVAVQKTLPRSIEALFARADASYSSEQGRLLNARAVLRDKGESLTQQMGKSMEQLLNRSFQTTYNTFRPSSALTASADSLSLVDSSAFEDELRINDITKRFRSEAEEQLRDLNIRVALLFGQDTIKERENPFRPYLFSRCIATAIENFGLSTDLSTILLEQLAENFAVFVSTVYNDVNTHLAKHGVAAQLQLKIKKSPTSTLLSSEDASISDATDDDDLEQLSPSSRSRFSDSSSYEIDGKRYDVDSRAISTDTPKRRMEQLFNSLRGMTNGLSTSNQYSGLDSNASQQPQPVDLTAAKDAKESKFGWLSGGQTVGSALRKFFSNDAPLEDRAAAAGFRNSGMHGMQNSGSELQPDASSYDPRTSGINRRETYSADNQSGKIYGNATDSAGQAIFSAHNIVRGDGAVNNDTIKTESNNGTHLSQSLSGMQRSYTPSTADMLDGKGEVRNLILEQRSSLNEMTKNVDEQMTIDIVAMLFEFILRDNQVPAEVRAQLGRLQFLVLKVALRDTSLLTQKGHPARMLVNRIGSISLGLKQLDPSGKHITEEICRIVEALLQDENESPSLFAKMLDEFDAFIAKELRASDKNIERTIDAVEQIQNRTLRFAHTAAQLGEALQGLTIDSYLQDFLENTWVHSIELAERSDSKRARRYRLLVPDLLWSIIPKLKEDDRAQLFALLPIILNTLREGLALITWDLMQQQKLLNWLVDAHTNVLRSSHSQTFTHVPTLSAIHEHFNNFVNNPEAGQNESYDPSNLTKNQHYLEQAIKDLDLKVQMLDQIFDRELPAEGKDVDTSETQIELSPEYIQEKLRNGVALEINLGGNPSIGRLNWVNPNFSNLVLSLEGQNKPSVVSARMFRRMISHGRVRFLEKEPLFERAVQFLLLSADQIDKTSDLKN